MNRRKTLLTGLGVAFMAAVMSVLALSECQPENAHWPAPTPPSLDDYKPTSEPSSDLNNPRKNYSIPKPSPQTPHATLLPHASPQAPAPSDEDSDPDPLHLEHGPDLSKAIQASIWSSTAALNACVNAWPEGPDAPLKQGRLLIGLHLDEQGLESTEFLDIEDVPEVVAECFGHVLYEIEWPRIDGEADIEYPFVLRQQEE